MDDFCGSAFWDNSLTWNTTHPDFTQCFQDTVLVWIPCGFLWLFAPLDAFFNYNNKANRIPWTVLIIAKILLASLLGVLAVVDLSHAMVLYSDGVNVDPSNYYSSFVKALTYILLIVLANLNRIRGSTTSGVLFLFWLLMSIKEIISYYSILLRMFRENTPYSKQADDFTFIIATCSMPLVLGQLILFSFADTKPNFAPKGQSIHNECPEESSSFLSHITFWWFNSMALLGYRQPLAMDDMWSLSSHNTSKTIGEHFDKHWIPMARRALEQSRNESSVNADTLQGKKSDDPNVKVELKPRVNIFYPLLKTFALELAVTGFFKLVGSLMVFVSPVILDYLITFVSSDEPYWRGFFYAAILFISAMLESIFISQYEYISYCFSMKVRSAVTSAIYKKSLLLSSRARRNYTVGEIVNLMAVDIQRIMEFFQVLHYIWSAPLQIAVSLYMLWQQIGISTLGGMGVMLLLIPLNGYVTFKYKSVQVSVMKEKDKRTKLMNEVLNGMKVLKLYAWEESFQEQVVDVRKDEIKGLYKQAIYTAFILFSLTAAPFLVSLASFAMYVLVDPSNVLDSNKAFVSLALFNIVRLPFTFLPFLLTMTATFLVSLKRLNIYLGSDEVDPDCISHNRKEGSPVIIENGTFSWDSKEAPLLNDINLRLIPGSLVAIVGTVGAGKSSLLSALLGDMEKITGRVNITADMAFVPQQAWIQNATLRKNILFTKSFEEHRYNKVLEACCLKPDLEILAGGDETEIGEKGINLSGGQKQRVSLARAVYYNADIYLLDDPLSAVDAHVSKDLFDNVIGPKGLLSKSTRILVTHRITVLPDVDTIIVLKDGRISEEGSYEELLKQKGAFAEFLEHHISQIVKEDDIVSPDELKLMEEIANKVGSPGLQRQFSRFSGAESEGTEDSESRDGRSLMRKFSTQVSQISGSSKDTLRRRSSAAFGATRQSSVLSKEEQSLVKDMSKLTEAEVSEIGSVKWSIYLEYFKACGIRSSFWVLIFYICAHAFTISSSIWLSEWSNDSLDPAKIYDTDLRNLRLGVYGGLGGAETIFTLAAFLILSIATLVGSRLVHDRSLDHILRAPMSFFDTTPVGRIVNRFSKDLDAMDNIIRMNIRMFLSCLFRTLVTFIVISLQTPYFLLVILPLGIVYYVVQKYYTATSRQLKRLESVSRSPIYTHFSETVTGCSSIRAYGAGERFIAESNERVDINNTSFFPSLSASRWLAIRLEFLGYTISFLAALFAVIRRDSLSSGLAGLSISYALTITSTLNMMVRASADLETNIVSVERCLEYTTTPIEAPRQIKSTKSPSSWPSEGRIQFNGYSTRYREGLDLVLKKLSCEVNPKEKVGIVGRTGAGKSSLTLSLFRLIEAAEGNITIDGLDIASLGLYDLRSKLTIIPQDPVLFTGTMRMNLDPFSRCDDDAIWIALEQSHLKPYVTTLENGLDHIITEGGENLSVGQCQLLCLARALLRKSKVLIMDEATAAVDMETDELIQITIRTEFTDCTVFTIAHRLNTIMDYDRVMVLDKGEIAEFDSPSNLLQNQKSIFYGMAKDADLV